jgi:hypothetical protein
MVYTDIGRLKVEKRNEYFNELIETKRIGIPFCQLGEFLLYCYWKGIKPKLAHYSIISEVQWLTID